MSQLTIPPGATYTVINATTIEYAGTRYENVTDIANPDGSHQLPGDLITAAGGTSYSANELKACVKVEAIDPDANGRQLFSVYSSNSQQVGKNVSSVVPGGVWVEVFDFTGDPTTNPILGMVNEYLAAVGIDWRQALSPTWRGFKINYGTRERRAYVLTQVNAFQEESIPSPPTEVDVTIMHDVALNGLFQAPAPFETAVGEAQYVPLVNFRLYRSNVTSAGSFAYQRVPVEPVGVPNGNTQPPQTQGAPFPGAVYVAYPRPWPTTDPAQYTFGYRIVDNVEADALLEVLPSIDWDAPPPRELYGLTAWRNGMMVAYAKNMLYFFEPYRPFTAPQKYIVALPWNVVGICADENSLVVVTEGEPYIINGSHPSNVVYERLQNVQAALKPTSGAGGFIRPTRALCRTPNGVLYASREGVVQVQGGRAVLAWRNLFTREEWQQRYIDAYPDLHLAYFDGRVLGLAESDGFGLLMDMNEGSLVEYAQSDTLVATFTLPQTDSLYISGSSMEVSRFGDEDTPRLPCTYHTRDVIVPRPCNFGALQIVGAGAVTATVFADDQTVATLAFTLGGQQTQRLPAGFKARKWSVLLALAADAVVSEMYLAETPSDLADA